MFAMILCCYVMQCQVSICVEHTSRATDICPRRCFAFPCKSTVSIQDKNREVHLSILQPGNIVPPMYHAILGLKDPRNHVCRAAYLASPGIGIHNGCRAPHFWDNEGRPQLLVGLITANSNQHKQRIE
jgi:hypothetical protein